jgi:hypothetical protein
MLPWLPYLKPLDLIVGGPWLPGGTHWFAMRISLVS